MSLFHEVKISIPDDVLDKIVKACPYSSDPGEAISFAISSYLEDRDKINISKETLRLIASKADMPEIQSEKQLVAAVEKAAHLNTDAVVLQLDQNIMPMVYNSATSNGIPVGEQLREYFHHAINMGWFSEVYMDTRYFNVTEDQYKRLCIEFGVEKIKDGNHLFSLVLDLAKHSVPQVEEAKVLRSWEPEQLPASSSSEVEGLI